MILPRIINEPDIRAKIPTGEVEFQGESKLHVPANRSQFLGSIPVEAERFMLLGDYSAYTKKLGIDPRVENPTGNIRYPGLLLLLKSNDLNQTYGKGNAGLVKQDLNFYRYVLNDVVTFFDETGLTCTYSQSTGNLSCVDQLGQTYLDVAGYSGKNAGKNNPALQGVADLGPIPQGTYIVGAPNSSKGVNTRPLSPDAQTREKFPAARKPDSFLMHGDNPQTIGESSEGCVIVNGPDIRAKIPTGETLNVVQ